jgi:serine/threonine-protein kinase HipA
MPIRNIEIYLDGNWVPAASLERTSNGWWFEYLPDYVFERNDPPPVSLAEPVQLATTLRKAIPAFIFDLVPQGRGRNFLVQELGLVDGDTEDVHWELALHGAFNPIGNLRIDRAVRYYAEHAGQPLDKQITEGFELREILAKQDVFLEYIWLHAMLHAGTTGAQGVAPKFQLTEGLNGRWHADAALADAQAVRHWLVKMPRGTGEAHETVLRNEHAYIEVARRCGLRAMEPAMLHGRMLFLPRFDRVVENGTVHRLHQESLASLAGIAGFGLNANQFTLAEAIARHATNRVAELAEFIKRDILNLALGNTDNHARNTAMQRTLAGEVQLAPVFDMAPMYLDPEVIIRGCRWRRRNEAGAPEGAEVTELEAVISGLPVADDERQRIACAVMDMAPRLETLVETMRECGVDREVVETRKPYIEAQGQRIAQLGKEGAKHGR